MVLLGRWVVHFYPDAQLNGNGDNIRLPAQKIDGTIVKPGDRFSFVNAVEPVNCPPYGMGGALRHGQIVEGKICGGGMCSTSTTLFNAAVRAGLDIVERHAHALYISRYPVGLDATVWDQGPGDGENMIFINDTGNPILIKGYGKRRKVIFEIWGTDDGRTVSFSDPLIENKKPATMYMEYTDSLAPGVTQKEWDNYDGFDATVVRTVKDANGHVIHSDTFHSHYHKLDGLTLVGRYPDDPPDGTTIPKDQYVPHG
jgi:vancomycin resistance protein YoaR